MKKTTTRALRLYVAVLVALLMLLTGCDDSLMDVLPVSPSPAPSSTAADSEQETPLPPQYFVKNGWLLLDLRQERDAMKEGKLPVENMTWIEISSRFKKAISPEDMGEKLMAVRFAPEELERLLKLAKDGMVQMIDPRLLAPLNVPDGLSLSYTEYECGWSSRAGMVFFYQADHDEADCDTLMASIRFEDGEGGQGQRNLDNFMDRDGQKVTLEDGTSAICIEGEVRFMKRQALYYQKEHNGRLYYVEQIRYLASKNGKPVDVDYLKNNDYECYTTVTTVHKGHQFSYTVTYPENDLYDRILECDPFTYL